MPDITNPQIIGALIAFGGVTLGIVSSWIVAIINRHYDERRHRREVAFNLALEHWRSECERAKWTVEHHPNTKVTVASIDNYIIRAAVLADMLDSKPNSRNIAEKLKRAQSIYDAARAQTEIYSAGLSQSKPHDA